MNLFPDIVSDCDNAISKEIKRYACHVNRASAIGDICERKLVYERTHWQEKKLHDAGLEYIFRIGNQLETPVLRLIEDAGFEVTRQQEPFLYKQNNKTLLSGHIDGVLVDANNEKYVLEVKTMHPAIWQSMESVRDFERHHWTKKYPWQLTMYMFGLEIPQATWILVNKSSGRLKQINYTLDYDFAEKILQRCERINNHVENGTLPDYLQGNPDYCESCPFLGICTPPLERESMQMIVDENLIKDIDEMQELEPSSKRYEMLKKSLKEKLADKKTAYIGTWKYDGKKRSWSDRWEKIDEKEAK